MNGLTQKQEAFCLNLFQGKSQRDAYIAAGYSSKQLLATIDHNACVLANRSKVVARWEELRQAAEDASVANVMERKQVLTEIVRARMTDFMTVGADGTYFDVGPEKLNTAGIMSAGSKTEIDKDGNGQTVFTRVYLRNPLGAIDLLNKMDKLYTDGATVNVDNRTLIIEVTDEELAIIATTNIVKNHTIRGSNRTPEEAGSS